MPDDLRCSWVPATDELYQRYHDQEWGFPVDDDDRLFEKLCLEGFQAGLSWRTILGKRDSFRRAFHGFHIERVACFDESDVARLLGDAGIVRHAGKIRAAIGNAQRAQQLRQECGSLANYIWRFEPDPAARPQRVTSEVLAQLTTSPASDRLSRDLKRRGWRFVGPTTCYAFSQAVGLVNDHEESCATRGPVEAARDSFARPSGPESSGQAPTQQHPNGKPSPTTL